MKEIQKERQIVVKKQRQIVIMKEIQKERQIVVKKVRHRY